MFSCSHHYAGIGHIVHGHEGVGSIEQALPMGVLSLVSSWDNC
jgi:hypothetical protein